ncbi:MAG TPA: UDP-N-acetylmuramoyl-L-alanine--D-glutamate ligase [Actinomycetaceae bacterium]|nr:UDP-N-acetylmuramoyl-L-alanine--D-glutamate ligase [Actinomycetaceae bacterium]
MSALGLASARFVVVGLGTTGLATMRALREIGARASGIDTSPAALEAASAALGGDAHLHLAADADRLAEEALTGPAGSGAPDHLVVSPGVPATSPLLRRAAARGVSAWSEVELAWRLHQAGSRAGVPWLTVTGTNGKTTTVEMLAAILRAAGREVAMVGNIGTPVIDAVMAGRGDVFAVELSSFQLHLTHTVEPQASSCLNLDADHLDWHGSMAAYHDAKARVYSGTRVACVYNVEDEATREMVAAAEVQEGARAVGTTLGAPQVGQLGVVADVLCDRAFVAGRQREAQYLAELDDLAHLAPAGVSPHIVSNALAAAALARAHGVAPGDVAQGLRDYPGQAHRIQHVGVVDGVAWINDSKATNSHAAAASIAGVKEGSAVWIAGGLAKDADFADLIRHVRTRLRAVVLIGQDRRPLRSALERHAGGVPIVEVAAEDTGNVMSLAVRHAYRLARRGDTVLLAPACASMDQFADYAARGEAFIAAVEQLR